MALDSNLFRLQGESTKAEIIRNRQSDSDYIEAKANVEAQRIIGNRGDVVLTDEVQSDIDSQAEEPVNARGFVLPAAEDSGLIDYSITPDESQVAAIKLLRDKQYGCLIGAAGTGKTTMTRRLLHSIIYGDEEAGLEGIGCRRLDGRQGLSIALCAFTGIATQVIKQNMPEWLHISCKTIHSLLEYMPVMTEITQKDGSLKETQVFMPTRDAMRKLDHDVIVIDEASMVGIDLWHQILDAARKGTRIYLIGDLNQLPPVMSQSMFAYTLAQWPVAELKTIHRQKEPAANKIIDIAHAILEGREGDITFDNPGENPNWRVLGYELDPMPTKAGAQIVTLANALRTKRVAASVDPEEPLVYDPYRDRIITAGNGEDENNANSSVQQIIINEALSRLIEPPSEENPVIVIDAGLSKKKFAVHHRVMATRNESPDIEDRVTNGMVGVIVAISRNPGWEGEPRLVGPETEVNANRNAMMDALLKRKSAGVAAAMRGEDEEDDSLDDSDFDGLDDFSMSMEGVQQNKGKEGGGPASHAVTVKFANGATRVFTSKAQVHSLMLAYASTCHKCQGSQFDTAIIVCHHAVKGQLSREWLYTAVTRAQKRVILLYTKYGLRAAITRQKIFGRSLEEKIRKYQQLQEDTVGLYKKGRIRLYIDSVE